MYVRLTLFAAMTDTSKPRDDVYGPYDSSYLQTSMPKTHTQSPAVTGTSVLGVKYNGGVVIAADNLGACGDVALRVQAADTSIQLHMDLLHDLQMSSVCEHFPQIL